MHRLWMPLIIVFLVAPNAARPQARDITLFVSPALVDSGLMKFLLPRFSLKTGVKIDLQILTKQGVIPKAADVVLTDNDAAAAGKSVSVMSGLGKTYYVVSPLPGADQTPGTRKAARFVDWLLADIGQRAIEQFRRDGKQLFAGAAPPEAGDTEGALTGNVVAGATLSYDKCGRCHVIGVKNRMKGIGSTPSAAHADGAVTTIARSAAKRPFMVSRPNEGGESTSTRSYASPSTAAWRRSWAPIGSVAKPTSSAASADVLGATSGTEIGRAHV